MKKERAEPDKLADLRQRAEEALRGRPIDTSELSPEGTQRLVVYRLEDGEKKWMGVVPRGNASNIEPGRYQTHLKRRLRKKIKEGQSPYMNSLRGTLVPAKETDEL